MRQDSCGRRTRNQDRTARSLDPSNAEWPMAREYEANILRGSELTGKEAAEKALEVHAFELSDEYDRETDWLAFEAGQHDKARQYGLLQGAKAGMRWNYGNRVHHGNLVLGRIALAEGNVEAAKFRLIAAGNTPGSPGLKTSGPNMTLAKLPRAGRARRRSQVFPCLYKVLGDGPRKVGRMDRSGQRRQGAGFRSQSRILKRTMAPACPCWIRPRAPKGSKRAAIDTVASQKNHTGALGVGTFLSPSSLPQRPFPPAPIRSSILALLVILTTPAAAITPTHNGPRKVSGDKRRC